MSSSTAWTAARYEVLSRMFMRGKLAGVVTGACFGMVAVSALLLVANNDRTLSTLP